MRQATGNILIAAGLIVVLLIAYEQHRQSMETNRLLEQLESLQDGDSSQQAKLTEAEENRTVTVTAKSREATDQEGETAIALIEIPAIELKAPVVEGSGKKQLKSAVGHLTYSGMLGREGDNVALAGHRTGVHGHFFKRLDELKQDDAVVVVSAGGQRILYRVTDKQIVKPTDVEVLKPVRGKTMLTLITCHPLHSNKQRLIVTAERTDTDTV